MLLGRDLPPCTQETEEPEEAQGPYRGPGLSKEGPGEGSYASCVSCVQPLSQEEFREYLKRAAALSTGEVVRHRDSMRRQDYRSPALRFARCLKALPEFDGLGAEEAAARVDSEVEEMFPEHPAPWVALGLPDFSTREDRAVDPRSDLIAVWDTIRTPFHLHTVVDEAAKLAESSPLDLGGRYTSRGDAGFARFISLCYWMGQLTRHGGVFFLSVSDAARAVDVSRTTANQMFKRAETAGHLVLAEPYTDKDRDSRKARKWTFVTVPGPQEGRSHAPEGAISGRPVPGAQVASQAAQKREEG